MSSSLPSNPVSHLPTDGLQPSGMAWPTRRFADPSSAMRYPLAVTGEVQFSQTGRSEWTVHFPIAPLASDLIMACSFVTPGAVTPDHQFVLVASGRSWPLLPVPSLVGERPDQQSGGAAVSTHIDCWHTHEPLAEACVVLTVNSAEPPVRYFIAMSARPLAWPEPAALPGIDCLAQAPRALSQMTAEEPLRRHICSPTSVAMLLSAPSRDEVLAWTRDRATGLHGSWPLAVRAAALHGAVAAVELHANWDCALQVLAAGLPFAASIRFAEGNLQGSPLTSTGGHLVVVHGVEGNSVLVHDPAADTDQTVARRYDLAQFTAAWLAMRGASYIIAP